MFAVFAKLLPAARNFSRQIIPPVVATLIAALLIAGFNRAFSGHLVQPRMAAMHSSTGQGTRPIVYAANPNDAVSELAPAAEPAIRERIFAKDDAREAGKDQTTFKVATAPVAAPAAPRASLRRSEPTEVHATEPRAAAEQRVASVPVVVSAPPAMAAPPVTAQPIAPIAQQPVAPVASQPVTPHPIASQAMAPQPMAPQATAPQPITQAPIAQQPIMQQPLAAPGSAPAMPSVVAQEPPPVIMAKPMVTVPDRARPAYAGQAYPNQAYPNQAYSNQPYPNQAYPNQANPSYDPRQSYGQQQAQADEDYARPREPRPLERFVDAIKPSSIFNRMREFGDRIEAAGNEILPTIRQ